MNTQPAKWHPALVALTAILTCHLLIPMGMNAQSGQDTPWRKALLQRLEDQIVDLDPLKEHYKAAKSALGTYDKYVVQHDGEFRSREDLLDELIDSGSNRDDAVDLILSLPREYRTQIDFELERLEQREKTLLDEFVRIRDGEDEKSTHQDGEDGEFTSPYLSDKENLLVNLMEAIEERDRLLEKGGRRTPRETELDNRIRDYIKAYRELGGDTEGLDPRADQGLIDYLFEEATRDFYDRLDRAGQTLGRIANWFGTDGQKVDPQTGNPIAGNGNTEAVREGDEPITAFEAEGDLRRSYDDLKRKP